MWGLCELWDTGTMRVRGGKGVFRPPASILLTSLSVIDIVIHLILLTNIQLSKFSYKSHLREQ